MFNKSSRSMKNFRTGGDRPESGGASNRSGGNRMMLADIGRETNDPGEHRAGLSVNGFFRGSGRSDAQPFYTFLGGCLPVSVALISLWGHFSSPLDLIACVSGQFYTFGSSFAPVLLEFHSSSIRPVADATVVNRTKKVWKFLASSLPV